MKASPRAVTNLASQSQTRRELAQAQREASEAKAREQQRRHSKRIVHLLRRKSLEKRRHSDSFWARVRIRVSFEDDSNEDSVVIYEPHSPEATSPQ